MLVWIILAVLVAFPWFAPLGVRVCLRYSQPDVGLSTHSRAGISAASGLKETSGHLQIGRKRRA